MKFTGRDDVHVYDDSTTFRQTPRPGPRKWQDSTWLQWWDDGNKVGGVHRIGHEYNLADSPPMISAWTALITPKGVGKRVAWLPLREEDKLPCGWGGGDGAMRQEFVDGAHVWCIDDPEANMSAELHFRDHYVPFRTFPTGGKTAEEISSDHIDVAGSVKGWIKMDGQTFAADGQGLRDHGWGYRDVNLILSHRYVTGAFGPDLSFCCYAVMNGAHDSIETFGFVQKGDTVHFAKAIDILAYVENDAATTRGGRIRITLSDDSVLDVELTAVAPGIMGNMHNMWNTNTLCRATTSDGRVGSGMFETSLNFHQGSRAPGKMVGNLLETGYYPGANTGRARGPHDHFVQIRTL